MPPSGLFAKPTIEGNGGNLLVSVPQGAKMMLQYHNPATGEAATEPSEVLTAEMIPDIVARFESDQRDTLAQLEAQVSAMEERVAEVLRSAHAHTGDDRE